MKCPKCEGEIQELGEHAFCLQCEWDNLPKIDSRLRLGEPRLWFSNHILFCLIPSLGLQIKVNPNPFSITIMSSTHNTFLDFWLDDSQLFTLECPSGKHITADKNITLPYGMCKLEIRCDQNISAQVEFFFPEGESI